MKSVRTNDTTRKNKKCENKNEIAQTAYLFICFDYSVTWMTPYSNLYAPTLIGLCVPHPRGFALCLHIVTTYSRVCISVWIRVYASYEYTHTMFISKMYILCAPTPPWCVIFNHDFICIYSIHLNTFSLVNVYAQTVQSTLKRIHVNRCMQKKFTLIPTYIYIYNEHKPIKIIKFTYV